MVFPKVKLKNQLAIINALSKVLIIGISVFIIPWLVNKMSIREIDNQLINKLDTVYTLIEKSGVDAFIDTEEGLQSFGSYNILKEEYVSMEVTQDTSLYELIQFSKRNVEGEILDYRVISATIQYQEDYYLIEIGKSIVSILSFEKQLKKFAFYFLLILLTLTVLLDLSIIRILLKPFDQIIQKLKQSHHPTHFDYTSVKTSTSDFKYLEENIHGLMRKIEAAFTEERDYISNISHELLTPISIIRTKLENFVNTTSLTDEEIVKIMESRATLGRLTKLVRTLLLFSRMENEEYLRSEVIDVRKLILEVADEFVEHFGQKDVEFERTIDLVSLNYKGNSELLHIMFYNLLYNALKFTQQGGRIKLHLFDDNSNPTIEITDNGTGISTEDLPFVFTRFKKFHQGQNSFGLGLALVKKICDYHGFTIEVTSALQVGTRFVIHLKKL